MESKLILDIKGLIIRAMHAGKDNDGVEDSAHDGSGELLNRPTFNVKTFMDLVVFPMLQEFSPRNIIAVWDHPDPTMRHLMYSEYKKRPSKNPKLKSALRVSLEQETYDRCREVLTGLGVTSAILPGVEADDIIAYICKNVRAEKTVWTVDDDLIQLVNDNTVVVSRGTRYEVGNFWYDKDSATPVEPRHLALWKSMIGDTTDNYSGVPQFGPKAWQHLIDKFEYDVLDDLIECVDKKSYRLIRDVVDSTGNKVLEKLHAGRDKWELCWYLANLHPELINTVNRKKFNTIKWRRRLPDRGRVLSALGLEELGERYQILDQWFPKSTLVTADNYEDGIADMLRHMADCPHPAIDIESYDTLKNPAFKQAANGRDYVDPLSQKVTGMSVCVGSNYQHNYYFSVNHKATNNLSIEQMTKLVDLVKSKPIAHNADFEMIVLRRNFGVQIDEPVDTRIFSHYVDENTPNGLKDLGRREFNYVMASYRETLEAAGAEDMSQISGLQVMHYGCDDSFVSAHLYSFYELLLELEGQLDFVITHETCVTHELVNQKENGVIIDYDRLKKLEEADVETRKIAWVDLKQGLETHCSELNEEAAIDFFNEDKEFYVAKAEEKFEKECIRAKEKGEHPPVRSEVVQTFLAEIRQKAINSSRYVPAQTIKKHISFSPTANQLTKVLRICGAPEGVEMDKVSAKAVTEFMATNSSEDWWNEELKKFGSLLAKATPQLKDREGDDYAAFATFCADKLSDLATEEVVGDQLNLDSPAQMSQLLYCKLALPVRLRTKVQMKGFRHKNGLKGSPATDKKAIDMAIAEDCSGEYDWKKLLLRATKVIKEIGTRFELYYGPYPLWAHPLDGKIHPSILNCGTATRRPTGTAPNIFQVAKGRMRSIFLPHKKDARIVSNDFSGQELRIMTSESRDEVLLDAYLGEFEKDIHTVTSCMIAYIFIRREMPALWDELVNLGLANGGVVEYSWYNKARKVGQGADEKTIAIADLLVAIRNISKAVNFLIIYGGGPSTLARNLGIPTELAKEIMRAVFAAYPGISVWQNEVIEFARTHGYVVTAYGTRKHLTSDLFSKDDGKRMRMERQAVNQTIQGCAADILKVVLAECKRRNFFNKYHAQLIAPVYDEITASVESAAIYDYNCELAEIMTVTPPGHLVPMKPETDIGPNWGEMLELGNLPSKEKVEEAILWLPDRLQAERMAAEAAEQAFIAELDEELYAEEDEA